MMTDEIKRIRNSRKGRLRNVENVPEDLDNKQYPCLGFNSDFCFYGMNHKAIQKLGMTLDAIIGREEDHVGINLRKGMRSIYELYKLGNEKRHSFTVPLTNGDAYLSVTAGFSFFNDNKGNLHHGLVEIIEAKNVPAPMEAFYNIITNKKFETPAMVNYEYAHGLVEEIMSHAIDVYTKNIGVSPPISDPVVLDMAETTTIENRAIEMLASCAEVDNKNPSFKIVNAQPHIAQLFSQVDSLRGLLDYAKEIILEEAEQR